MHMIPQTLISTFKRVGLLCFAIVFFYLGIAVQDVSAACTTYYGSESCASVAGAYGIPSNATLGSVSFSQTVCDGTWYPPVMTGGGCYAPTPPPPPPPPPPVCTTYTDTVSCSSVAGSWGIPVYHTHGSVTYSQTVCDGSWQSPVVIGGGCSAPPVVPTPCTKTNQCGTHTTTGTITNGVCNAPTPNPDNSCIVEVCTTHGPVTETCAAAKERLSSRDGDQPTYFGYPPNYTVGTVTYTQDSCVKNGVTTWKWPEFRSGSYCAPPVVTGCMDSRYAGNGNYNASANSASTCSCNSGYTWSGSSCVASVVGCMNPAYAGGGNYNASANVSGSCSCNTGYSWNGSSCAAGIYTYSFNTNGGSPSVYTSVNATMGTTVNSPGIPTRAGYTFTGWSPSLPRAMPVGGGTSVAQWVGNPPASPSGLSAAPGSCGTGQIHISWSATSGATKYILRDGSTVVYQGPATSFTHTGLTAGSVHSYTVSAENANGTSAYSSSVSATVPAVCPSGNISANPTSVMYNSPSMLSWTTANAQSCMVGVQALSNSDTWNGTSNAGVTTSPLVADTTYVLTCDNTILDTETITVLALPALVAVPSYVRSGDEVTLYYDTQGQSCTLNGQGVNGNSSMSVRVNARTTYTINCPGGSVSTTVEIVPSFFET